MKRNIHLLQAAYILIFVVGILWAFLSEMEYVPTEYIPASPNADYAVSLLSIATALGGTYFALRLTAFKSVRRKFQAGELPQRQRFYVRLIGLRTVIIALAIWLNIAFYYGCSSVNTTQYCILIALLAALFCRPSKSECDSLVELKEKEKTTL